MKLDRVSIIRRLVLALSLVGLAGGQAWAAQPGGSVAGDLELCWQAPTPMGQPACTLSAGAVLVSRLRPAISLSLDGGWIGSGYYPDGLGLMRPDENAEFTVLVAPVSGQSGGDDLPIARSAEGVLAYLEANPAMAVIGPSVDVSIGGLPAKRLDLSAVVDAASIIHLQTDDLATHLGDVLRVWAVDDAGLPVVFIADVHSPVGYVRAPQDQVDSFFTLATTMVDSVTFPAVVPHPVAPSTDQSPNTTGCRSSRMCAS